MKLCAVLTLVFYCIVASNSLAQTNANPNQGAVRPKVLLAIPSPDRFPFWLRTKQFAQAVSNSLGIELHILNFKPGDRNRYNYTEAMQKTINETLRPDVIIGMFWMLGESTVLDMIERQKIPFISFNSSLTKTDYSKLGYPGEKYRYWLAHISPDDVAAGEMLAQLLVSSLDTNLKPKMIAVSGDRTSTSSNYRMQGLNLLVQAKPQLN